MRMLHTILASVAAGAATAAPAWIGSFTGFTNALPNRQLPHVPLLGNGRLGVALDARNDENAASPVLAGPGRNSTLDMWLNSNNMWSCAPCGSTLVPGCCSTAALGGVSMVLKGVSSPLAFTARQIIGTATLETTFSTPAGSVITTRTCMHPREDVAVTNVTYAATGGDPALLLLQVATWVLPASTESGGLTPTGVGVFKYGVYASRLGSNATGVPVAWGSLATGVLGGALINSSVTSSTPGDVWEASSFVALAAGETLSIVTAHGETVGNPAVDPTPIAQNALAAVMTSPTGASDVAAAAGVWWADFWARSSVSLPSQPLMEQMWYGAQYILACSSSTDAAVAAPGLYGPWVTSDNPNWHGDYTLDYNYETPYFGAFSSNHAPLAEPYWAPVVAWESAGRVMAQQEAATAQITCPANALHFACHIAPLGMQSFDQTVYMHWNAHFAAMPFISHWEFTRNASFAMNVTYPLLDGLNSWWSCYMAQQNNSDGSYVFNDFRAGNPDAEHEGQLVPNPQIGMSFAVRTLAAQLDIARTLNISAPAYIEDLLLHIAPFNAVNVSVPNPANVTFNVTQDLRCHNDNGFLPTPASLDACEKECASVPACQTFTYCPSTNVSGCDKGPSCWQYAAGAPCSAFPGFVSGTRNSSSSNSNATVWTAFADATVGQSDWFAAYPVWPSEALAGVVDANAYTTGQMSSRLYADFANGRPVDLFSQAVLSASNGQSPPGVWTLDDIVNGFNAYLNNYFGPNLLAYAPGGGIENVAVAHALNQMLVSTTFNGVPGGAVLGSASTLITLFPAWPAEQPASFTGLLVKGGVSLSASYDNVTASVQSPVSVTVAYALDGPQAQDISVAIANPWGDVNVTVTCGGATVPVTVTVAAIQFAAPAVGVACSVAHASG